MATDELYQVERIEDDALVDPLIPDLGRLWFVKWQSYEEKTWEPKEHLEHLKIWRVYEAKKNRTHPRIADIDQDYDDNDFQRDVKNQTKKKKKHTKTLKKKKKSHKKAKKHKKRIIEYSTNTDSSSSNSSYKRIKLNKKSKKSKNKTPKVAKPPQKPPFPSKSCIPRTGITDITDSDSDDLPILERVLKPLNGSKTPKKRSIIRKTSRKRARARKDDATQDRPHKKRRINHIMNTANAKEKSPLGLIPKRRNPMAKRSIHRNANKDKHTLNRVDLTRSSDDGSAHMNTYTCNAYGLPVTPSSPSSNSSTNNNDNNHNNMNHSVVIHPERQRMIHKYNGYSSNNQHNSAISRGVRDFSEKQEKTAVFIKRLPHISESELIDELQRRYNVGIRYCGNIVKDRFCGDRDTFICFQLEVSSEAEKVKLIRLSKDEELYYKRHSIIALQWKHKGKPVQISSSSSAHKRKSVSRNRSKPRDHNTNTKPTQYVRKTAHNKVHKVHELANHNHSVPLYTNGIMYNIVDVGVPSHLGPVLGGIGIGIGIGSSNTSSNSASMNYALHDAHNIDPFDATNAIVSRSDKNQEKERGKAASPSPEPPPPPMSFVANELEKNEKNKKKEMNARLPLPTVVSSLPTARFRLLGLKSEQMIFISANDLIEIEANDAWSVGPQLDDFDISASATSMSTMTNQSDVNMNRKRNKSWDNIVQSIADNSFSKIDLKKALKAIITSHYDTLIEINIYCKSIFLGKMAINDNNGDVEKENKSFGLIIKWKRRVGREQLKKEAMNLIKEITQCGHNVLAMCSGKKNEERSMVFMSLNALRKKERSVPSLSWSGKHDEIRNKNYSFSLEHINKYFPFKHRLKPEEIIKSYFKNQMKDGELHFVITPIRHQHENHHIIKVIKTLGVHCTINNVALN